MGNSPCTASIHILDDDSLLHVFYLYRPFLLGEDQDDEARRWGGNGGWVRGRWWYRLAQVCQRWRNIILGSASYLELSLVCTYGTPIADMLAHSPPLPLAIDYFQKTRDMTAEDEEGIILALKKRNRVRRVRLWTPVTSLRKVIPAMDEEYPILEYLIILLPIEDNSSILRFSETLQAPHLRQLTLRGFALPIGSRLLAAAVGLVTLYLIMVHPSTYFHPNTLLQWISHMPQLEKLTIFSKFPILNHGVERQLAHMPIIGPPITLPNLCHFQFHGFSTYLEALVHRINAPRLERRHIELFNQLTFDVPSLLQLMNMTENLKLESVSFFFSRDRVYLKVFPRGETKLYALGLVVVCLHLDWQVSCMAQFSNPLRQMFSAVEHLNLEFEAHSQSSEEHNDLDSTTCRKLLEPFSNVKTLRIEHGLVKDISRCLESEDEELSLALLPKLQELTYSGSGDSDAGDPFASFIDARQNAGRPVILVRP